MVDEKESNIKGFALSSTKTKTVARCKKCGGTLKDSCDGMARGHMRGIKLELFLSLQSWARKHGVAYPSAQHIERKKICTARHARNLLKDLIRGLWIEVAEWHGRPGWTIRKHSEWVDAVWAAGKVAPKESEGKGRPPTAAELFAQLLECSHFRMHPNPGSYFLGWDKDFRSFVKVFPAGGKHFRESASKNQGKSLQEQGIGGDNKAAKAEVEGQIESQRESGDAISRASALLGEAFREKYGRQVAIYAKTKDALAEILANRTDSEVLAAWNCYLRSDTQYLTRECHPVAVFVSQFGDWAKRSHEATRGEDECETQYTMVEFEGRMVPDFVRDQIVTGRADDHRRAEERKCEEELERQEFECNKINGF